MKNWSPKQPQLLKKCVYNLAGLDAHAVLGVTPESTDAEIKRAYRRLLSPHHPDKLVSKGLPKEMIKLAPEKTHETRQAYEAITRARAN